MSPLSIRWEQSRAIKEWTHGYVGGIRVVTIDHARSHRVILKIHLPGGKGWRGDEECDGVEAAQKRAADVLAEFVLALGVRAQP